MLAEPNLKLFRELVSNASREELIWMNGFLAGMTQSAATPVQAIEAPAAAVQVKKITLTYGTETGNSKKLATQFAAIAKKKGIAVKLSGLDQYRLTDLAKEEYLFSVLSTQGDGEPPATAKKFYDHLFEQSAELKNLKYGILGLGDTGYPLFCKAAEDVDNQLEKLGGSRVLALQKCDTDYEQEAQEWFDQVLQVLSNAGANAPAGQAAAVGAPKKTHHKKIHTGTVVTNVNLNDRGSQKETYHIEITTDDAVEYLPGDAIGIIPHNKKQWVESILSITGLSPAYEVVYKDTTTTVGELLHTKLNIVHLPERVVAKYAAIVQQEIPVTRIDLVDLLKIYPVKDAAQFEEVIAVLEATVPRLYSIASSPAAHSGEIHVTVSRSCFPVNDEKKYGLCSDFLSQLEVNSTVDFYIHPNSLFRLPQENKDVIMIGPGTGIAPFRSFIAERDAAGAAGRNWLFFGEQHFVSDFLYQTEIQNYAQTGVLNKVSLAFSRDQLQKIYVQHRMYQEAEELWNWLEGGAYLYVCGAKAPMSVDVEQALLSIITAHGNKSAEEAQRYLEQLQAEGRYLKDVY